MTQRYDGAIITVRSDSITALVASLRWEFCKKGEWCGAVFRNFAKQILHLFEDHQSLIEIVLKSATSTLKRVADRRDYATRILWNVAKLQYFNYAMRTVTYF